MDSKSIRYFLWQDTFTSENEGIRIPLQLMMQLAFTDYKYGNKFGRASQGLAAMSSILHKTCTDSHIIALHLREGDTGDQADLSSLLYRV